MTDKEKLELCCDMVETYNIVFTVNNNSTEILRLEPNGDIYVRGKLTENDKEVVDSLREFIKLSNLF